MHRQIDQLAYAHTSFFTSDVVEQLADHLTRTAPGELNYAYFVSGGSEANRDGAEDGAAVLCGDRPAIAHPIYRP
ncbi:class III aminotransferase [Klebsiella variicola]|uniref:Class III aminotransferase n=1 Tax=Klebsiella variicola TaxID=244366 RepID=A0A7H4MHZ4_KLEVA|nr:class III aminotransferase [Klebsiella variicola]